MAGGYGARTTGTDGRLFADPQPGPDESSFQIDNTSEQYYNSAYYKLHQSQLQPVPPPRVDPPRMQLADILPAAMITQIQTAGRITFHAVGDTGAARVAAIPNEGGVADAMARDVAAGGPLRPIVNDIDAEFRPFITGDRINLWTNWNAPNWRILAADLHDPARAKWKEIVPESKWPIDGATGVAGRLFVGYLEDVNARVKQYDLSGKYLGDMKLPGIGSVFGPAGR